MASSRQVVIVTSALTMAEALAAKLTKEQHLKFAHIFSSPFVQIVDVDRRISGKAAAIRDHYDTRRYDAKGALIDGSSMAMGDAIHLATAIHINASAFYTLDGSGNRQRRLDLLRMNGDVAGAQLSIRVPEYVPPVEPLAGPQSPIEGNQGTLFDEHEQVVTPVSAGVKEADLDKTEQGEPCSDNGRSEATEILIVPEAVAEPEPGLAAHLSSGQEKEIIAIAVDGNAVPAKPASINEASESLTKDSPPPQSEGPPKK